MPAQSKAQRRLMAACENGAEYPACKKMQESMSKSEMHKFAKTSEKRLPEHASSSSKDVKSLENWTPDDDERQGFSIIIRLGGRKKD